MLHDVITQMVYWLLTGAFIMLVLIHCVKVREGNVYLPMFLLDICEHKNAVCTNGLPIS